MREGSLIKIEFEACLPADATREQVAEWVKFELGGGSMHTSNPLSHYDLEFWNELPKLTDLELIGRTEDFGHEPIEGGGTRCTRRYVREPITTKPATTPVRKAAIR